MTVHHDQGSRHAGHAQDRHRGHSGQEPRPAGPPVAGAGQWVCGKRRPGRGVQAAACRALRPGTPAPPLTMPWPGLPLAAPPCAAPRRASRPGSRRPPVPSGAVPSDSVPPDAVPAAGAAAPAAGPPGSARPGRGGRCHSPGGAIRSSGGDAVRACGRAHSTGMTRSGGAARGLGGAGRPAGGAAAGTRSMAWNPETGVSVPSPDRSWPSGSPRPFEPGVRPGGVLGAAGPKRPASLRPVRPAPHPGRQPVQRHRERPAGRERPHRRAVSQCVPAASCPYAPAASSSGNGGGEKGGMSVSEVAAMYSLKDPLLKSGAYSSKGSAGYSGGRFLPAPGRAPIQAERLPVLRKGRRAARTPRNGCKTHPPGKWHARYRKSTPVPALGPRCRSPALPACRY